MKTDYKDLMAYKFAVISLDELIKDSIPITEYQISKAVDDSIANAMVKDNSKSHRKEIINELMDNKYHAPMKRHSLVLTPGVSLVDPSEHLDWSIRKDFYWQKMHYPLICDVYKKKDPINHVEITSSIDDESDKILSLMEDPNRKEFSSKGLVIGYVQSGKTANFTALIAKALDSGYKLIVVLGGMHDSLRIQTQNRLNSELLGYDDIIIKNNPLPTVRQFYSQEGYEERRPNRVTTSRYIDEVEVTSKGDFMHTSRLKDQVTPITKYKSCIAVIKKNPRVMDRLLDWVKQCPEEIRKDIPLLIIDDEADQASIDSNYVRNRKKLEKKGSKYNKSELNSNATKINKNILALLKHFKRSSYVGYTATPYANVFIDLDKSYKNIYPKDFIHILPKPKAYFGAHQIFGNDTLRQAYVVTDGVDDKKIVSASTKDGSLHKSLEDSILTFLICLAIRIKRGESNKAMSMLIHINHINTDQGDVFESVKKRMEVIEKQIKYKNRVGNILRENIESLYVDVKKKGKRINKINKYSGPLRSFYSFKTILKVIQDEIFTKEILRYKKVNGQSNDDLNYDKFPDMKVIAIGGNKLSRGLTLEGLMVTFFVRDTSSADTLMQMGRFFGYRAGYNDVMKIFTTKQLVSDFSELIEGEDLLRSEVERYSDEGLTPQHFAPAVKAFLRIKPSGKMGNAKLNVRSFGSSESQTFKFKLKDPKLLQSNMETAVSFLNDLNETLTLESPKFKSENKLFRKVPVAKVINFLSQIDVGDVNMNQKELIKYIEEAKIKFFNIGLPNNTKKTAVIKEFGTLGKFGLSDRSRRSDAIDGYYDLGTLTSGSDKVMDLENKDLDYLDDRKEPLILLYRVNKASKYVPPKPRKKPKKSKGKKTSNSVSRRKDLFHGIGKKVDLLGLSILLPASKQKRLNHWVNRLEE